MTGTTIQETTALGEIGGWLLVLLLATVLLGISMVVQHWATRRGERIADEADARAQLARIGYRYLDTGQLWLVTHEDPEGWWQGELVGTYRTAVQAAVAARRWEQRRREQR